MKATTPAPASAASVASAPPPPHIVMKKKRKRLKPSERRIRLRDRIWPGAGTLIWHRLENDGYITIPKLLSLICALLKDLAANDPTRVYMDLWCRSFDEGIIEHIDEDQAAFSSGYVGTRAKRTWTEHMHQLEDLGFIKIAPDGNNQIGHVLMLNPLHVVDELRKKGTKKKRKVSDEWWHAYIARASEIGAFLPSDELEEDGDDDEQPLADSAVDLSAPRNWPCYGEFQEEDSRVRLLRFYIQADQGPCCPAMPLPSAAAAENANRPRVRDVQCDKGKT